MPILQGIQKMFNLLQRPAFYYSEEASIFLLKIATKKNKYRPPPIRSTICSSSKGLVFQKRNNFYEVFPKESHRRILDTNLPQFARGQNTATRT
ncbi:hypothetical protein AVEN_215547-1 [Araneus ventricosus]|uniref:Uncharacterized protein n=1 Tax=Araneus ventricosus TaxID=182803 RepID=A0A4Y2BEV9_ARAVE|nr:hypothetical protein AVEN_215547-1 [Araneus ventricosus]